MAKYAGMDVRVPRQRGALRFIPAGMFGKVFQRAPIDRYANHLLAVHLGERLRLFRISVLLAGGPLQLGHDQPHFYPVRQASHFGPP